MAVHTLGVEMASQNALFSQYLKLRAFEGFGAATSALLASTVDRLKPNLTWAYLNAFIFMTLLSWSAVTERILNAIRELAHASKARVAEFLSEIIQIRSLSGQEGPVVARIAEEMRAVGLCDVHVDAFGNVRGILGEKGPLICYDAHVDTVDAGNLEAWHHDPFSGLITNDTVYGRGASDQKAGMAAIVYAAKVLRDLGMELPFRFMAVGSVQEEDCDGLCWQYIISKEGLRPDCVVITEPTRCQVYRGHRGRMEIAVTVKGVSAHGSAPERGINAIYRIADILKDLQALNERLSHHSILGKGTLTVSEIRSSSPSLCAVADFARIHIDRRLTLGESRDSALLEIQGLPSVRAYSAAVELLTYSKPTHTGYILPAEKYYPSWLLEESHPAVQAASETFKLLFGYTCRPGCWTFSTNGVATAGMFGIPTVGFGPGDEQYAHAPNEKCAVADLIQAIEFYAAFGFFFAEMGARIL